MTVDDLQTTPATDSRRSRLAMTLAHRSLKLDFDLSR